MIPPISMLKIQVFPGAMSLDSPHPIWALAQDPVACVRAALEGLPPQTPPLDPALGPVILSRL